MVLGSAVAGYGVSVVFQLSIAKKHYVPHVNESTKWLIRSFNLSYQLLTNQLTNMPFIQNASYKDIATGTNYRKAGDNAILIQIVDPDRNFPVPVDQFKEVHQFKFLDAEHKDRHIDSILKCTQEQASELVSILKYALDNDMNVIVHCHMGLCRSGAVTEVGVIMGFEDTGRIRSPNLLVKHRMMFDLKLTYDYNEQPSTNGTVTESGIILPSTPNS